MSSNNKETNNRKDNPVWKKIGTRINSLIGEQDKTQKDLADYLKISPNVVSYWCKGERTPNTEQIIKISKFFNVSTDYLLRKTNIQTADTDLKAICEYTGLSEEAAEKLHEFHTAEYGSLYVERPRKTIEIVGIETDTEFNANAVSFINDMITDSQFFNIIQRAVKLKEDIAEMRATVPDNENEERAQMILTRQNIKTLHNVKRFVVTDDGHIEHTLDKMKKDFEKILENIFDDDELLD